MSFFLVSYKVHYYYCSVLFAQWYDRVMLKCSARWLQALPFEPMALTTLDILKEQLQRGVKVVHEEDITAFKSGHFFISPKHDGVRVVSYVNPISAVPSGTVEDAKPLKTCFSRHGRPIWGMQWIEQEVNLLRTLAGDPYMALDGELYLHKEEDKQTKKTAKKSKEQSVAGSQPHMTGFLAVAALVHRLRGKLQNPSLDEVLAHVPSLPRYCIFDVASYCPRPTPRPKRNGKGLSMFQKEIQLIQQRCLSEHGISDIRTFHVVPNVSPFSLRLRVLAYFASLLRYAMSSPALVSAYCPFQLSVEEAQRTPKKGELNVLDFVGGQYVKFIPYSLCSSLDEAQNLYLKFFVSMGFEGAVIRTPLNVYAMREKKSGTVAKMVSSGFCSESHSDTTNTNQKQKHGSRRALSSKKRESVDQTVMRTNEIQRDLLSAAVQRAKHLPRRSPTAVKLLLYKDDEFPVLRPLFKEPSANPRTRELVEVDGSTLSSSERIKKTSATKKKTKNVSFFGLQCLASNGRVFSVTLPKLSIEKQKELLRHLQQKAKGRKLLTGLYVTVKYSTLTEHGVPRFGTVKAIRGGKGWFL